VSDRPTTLEEVAQFPFLLERLDALTEAILQEPDDTVLWIGAGFSAKYAGLPTWMSFLQDLLQQNIPKDSPDFNLIQGLISSGRLAMAAECLQDVIGPKLLDTLTLAFGRPAQRLPEYLSYFGVRDVITTNYDNMLEQVLSWYESTSPSDGMEKLISNDFKIVKIHGSISEPQSCVLSLSAYVRAYNVNLHWYLASIFSNYTVVFLGTSMNPAEPYFRVLRLLRAQRRTRKRHFSIMAVPDSRSGSQEGKRLQDFGIELIPYIPDKDHSFIDEIMSYIESRRGSSTVVQNKLKAIRGHLAADRLFHAAIYLWHTCHADIPRFSDRRAIGDTVSDFFNRALASSGPGTTALIKQCERFGIDFPQLWQRTADLLVPSTKSVHGLRHSLSIIELATGRKYPYLGRRLTELEQQTAQTAQPETVEENPRRQGPPL
jgi:hypothetical protein